MFAWIRVLTKCSAINHGGTKNAQEQNKTLAVKAKIHIRFPISFCPTISKLGLINVVRCDDMRCDALVCHGLTGI